MLYEYCFGRATLVKMDCRRGARNTDTQIADASAARKIIANTFNA